MGTTRAKRLLLIGWDGADWQVMKPLMEQGRMPVLASLVSQGVMGNLASMEPMISPMLWTTIATGKPPHVHGICGFYEPAPGETGGVRLVGSNSRQCKALWNICSERGLHTSAVSWYASQPAEAVTGIQVSDQFAPAGSDDPEHWPVPAGSIQPPELAAELADLRIHPRDLTIEQIEFFLPAVRSGLLQPEIAIPRLTAAIAECATNQAITTWIMETQPWEVLAVYFNTIDHVGHSFMFFHPPRMEHVPEGLYEQYNDVVNATYCFHDLMLNRLMKLVDDDTAVMIVSDHGYLSGASRPVVTPGHALGPTVWHRPYGMFFLKGPGIRKDELVFGARLLDIAPTALTILGLPVGEDMTGRVLQQVFEHPAEVATIPSWEATGPRYGATGEPAADPFAEQAALRQLIELGYVEPMEGGVEAAIGQVTFDHDFNRARSLMGGKRLAEAAELLESLVARQPDRLFPALVLADCYQRMNRLDDCRRLVEHILQSRVSEKSRESEKVRILPQASMLLGMLESNAGNYGAAKEHLEKADAAGISLPGFHTQLGTVYLQLSQVDRAGAAFSRALEIEPDDCHALTGMASVHLLQGRDEQAIACALQSLEVLYHQPQAHYLLGLGLKRSGDLDRARQAMEVCLHMQPGHAEARRELDWLVRNGAAGQPL